MSRQRPLLRRARATRGEIEIRNAREIYSNRFGTLYDDDVLFKDGVEGRYIRFLWHCRQTVAVLPVLEDGRYLLLQNFRHAVREWVLEIPKGFTGDDADAETAARRELIEETGLVAARIETLQTLYGDPGFIGTPTELFIALGCTPAQAPEPEAEETIGELIALSPTEARTAIADGRVRDALTTVAILRGPD
ncbi:MAG: NUDIX hydrolase [Chromatiales bacterium]|nr:NUDIX hydrolase [Chromatiales bacterium]